MSRSKPCSITGCQAHTNAGHLMCRRHWRMVPRSTQAEVWDAWQGYRQAIRQRSREAIHEGLARYRLATKAAADSVIAQAGGI